MKSNNTCLIIYVEKIYLILETVEYSKKFYIYIVLLSFFFLEKNVISKHYVE